MKNFFSIHQFVNQLISLIIFNIIIKISNQFLFLQPGLDVSLEEGVDLPPEPVAGGSLAGCFDSLEAVTAGDPDREVFLDEDWPEEEAPDPSPLGVNWCAGD